jgi:phosphohistidine phosphatase
MKKKKVLHIVRHAKSSWDYEGISDADRPLKLKGIKNAHEMARRMKLRNSLPELIISSPANRALHTATIFAKVMEFPFEKINIDLLLYGSDANTIINMIKKTNNNINSLMIFGHNPDFTDIANLFIDEPVFEIPTSGLVQITFAVDNWMNIGKQEVNDFLIDFPKKDLHIIPN